MLETRDRRVSKKQSSLTVVYFRCYQPTWSNKIMQSYFKNYFILFYLEISTNCTEHPVPNQPQFRLSDVVLSRPTL